MTRVRGQVEWEFTLTFNRAISEFEADELAVADHPLLADGSLGYSVGGEGPARGSCTVLAPTVLDAISTACAAFRGVLPELYPVRVENGDSVTLDEAAVRCGQSAAWLKAVAEEHRGGAGGFPEPEFVSDGAEYYAWSRIAPLLRRLGTDAKDAPDDLLLADLLIRARAASLSRGVPDSVLAGLTGLLPASAEAARPTDPVA
ncbi:MULTISPECIES: hypothetical protein [Streptomyces]|uniref:hypothetical protein n=1 Tax=Streptomyces TaxID=1883 RepID=UPI000CD5999B|nr:MULTISPECIES: hypothetical protein [Streptomyces]